MNLQQLRSWVAINEANIKHHLQPKRKFLGISKLSDIRSLAEDRIIEAVLATQPTTRDEWYESHSLVRLRLREKLALAYATWTGENYNNFPRGYAVALIGLLQPIAKFQETHYALTMAYIKAAKCLALLETQTAESPFRPLKMKKAQPDTLLGLCFDDDEERYSHEDSEWRSRRDRDLREMEDYDDYEARQEAYVQMW